MNEQVRMAMQTAIDRAFQMNAMCDRMVYVMKIKMHLVKFADRFHHDVAHKYPVLADELADIVLGQDAEVVRGPVEAQEQTWDSLVKMMAEYRAAAEDTRQLIGDAYYKAFDNAEAHTAALVADVLEDYEEMVRQAIIFEHKAVQYGPDLHGFDNDTATIFGG